VPEEKEHVIDELITALEERSSFIEGLQIQRGNAWSSSTLDGHLLDSDLRQRSERIDRLRTEVEDQRRQLMGADLVASAALAVTGGVQLSTNRLMKAL